jgi:hypothetical protein
MERAPLKVRVKTMYEVLLEYLRKNLPIAMLVAGCFTVGYAVKNTEDYKDRQASHADLQQQQQAMKAECDARLIQNDTLQKGQMAERDSLLLDQTQRIADLEFLLHDLKSAQEHNHDSTQKQIADLKKMTTATKESITKEVTAKDRQVINSEVRAKK